LSVDWEERDDERAVVHATPHSFRTLFGQRREMRRIVRGVRWRPLRWKELDAVEVPADLPIIQTPDVAAAPTSRVDRRRVHFAHASASTG